MPLLAADELHTLFLGVFQEYVVTVLWALIDADVFGIGRQAFLSTQDAFTSRSGDRLRYEFSNWCKDERARDPDKPLYELVEFSHNTLGTRARPHLKAKAAESGTLLRFAVELARRYESDVPQGQLLLAAGRGLLDYLRITRVNTKRLDIREQQGLMDSWLRFLNVREGAHIPFKPKHTLSNSPHVRL